MDDKAPQAMIYYKGVPTGFISADAVSEGPATYDYMPLRNLPHLEFATAMREHCHAGVSVRLKGEAIQMTATGLTSRFLTLRKPEA